MNCKPGDLALIVRAANRENLGRIVEVLHAYLQKSDAWVVKGRGPGYWCFDADIRPIRDPGEDARDETLTWLPVPTKEIA